MLAKFRLIKKSFKKETDRLYDNSSMKVIIIGCIAIVVALLFMVIVSMAITKNAIINKLKARDLKNLAGSIGAIIEGKIEKAVDASIFLTNDPAVISWVESGDKNEAYGEIVKNRMRELVNSFGYDMSFLVSTRTFNYWSYDANEFTSLDVVSKDDKDNSWFFNTIGMKKKYEINIEPNKELNETFVWINALVGDLNDPIAAAGLGINLSKVTKELIREQEKNGIHNDIWLIDSNGVIYLSQNPEYLGKSLQDYLPPELMEAVVMQADLDNGYEIAEYRGKDSELYDIAYKRIMDTDWKLMMQIPRSESFPSMKAVTTNIIISLFIIILSMVAIFYTLSKRIANPYKRALQLNQELEKKVEDRTRELQDKNTKIQDSIEYAKMIQDTMIPSGTEMKMILKDYFVISRPRDTVGGDFYWVKNINDGFLLVVGDCTGHGVPGALMTTAVNAILNQIVDEFNNDNPAFILSELDRLVKQSFGKDGSEGKIQYGLDAGVVFVSKDRGILYSGANLSVIIKDVVGSICEIKGQAGTIDCINKNRRGKFTNTELDYIPGIALYIATDGITDQPGGDKLLPYGKSRLKASIKASGHLDMKLQPIQIMDEFEKYLACETLRDDITILGFRL